MDAYLERICMRSPLQPEYTLCGDAFDITAIDKSVRVYFADAGEIVTCERCRMVITACAAVKRWRLPQQSQLKGIQK